MGKVELSDIVKLSAFEDAGRLFYRITGMTISFRTESGDIIFYPAENRSDFCRLIQNTPEGKHRCSCSDEKAAEKAMSLKQPIAYKCHAGLTDVVVPVVVGGVRFGCFYSGQSLLEPAEWDNFQKIYKSMEEFGIDKDNLWEAYKQIPVTDSERLEMAMELLSVICSHLIENEIAVRQERALTKEQRKLRKVAEEKARFERDLREMELRLLQAQFNPHFLFNALNLILGNAMIEEAPETYRLVNELSQLLRNSLNNIGGMVPLHEEISGTRAYIEIFAARFGKKTNLDINIPGDVNNIKVPSLILQPIVENALVHAMPKVSGDLHIDITLTKSDDIVTIQIRDNGPGLPKEKLKRIQNSISHPSFESKLTGIAGLSKRLKYYYPDIKDITLQNTNPGLAVNIHIPQK